MRVWFSDSEAFPAPSTAVYSPSGINDTLPRVICFQMIILLGSAKQPGGSVVIAGTPLCTFLKEFGKLSRCSLFVDCHGVDLLILICQNDYRKTPILLVICDLHQQKKKRP